jgi:hypothetical protein
LKQHKGLLDYFSHDYEDVYGRLYNGNQVIGLENRYDLFETGLCSINQRVEFRGHLLDPWRQVNAPVFEGKNYDHCLLDVLVVREWTFIAFSGNSARDNLNDMLANLCLYGDVQLVE